MFEKKSPNTYKKVGNISYLKKLEELTEPKKFGAFALRFLVFMMFLEIAIFVTILVVRFSLWLG